VIYAILTEQNIARLFAAALLPGLLAAALYLGAIAVYMRRHPEAGPPEPRVPWPARAILLAAVWPVLAIFVVVLGGIYGGVFTATEAAAVGCLLTFGVGLAQRELDRPKLRAALLATAETTGMIFVIFVGADMLNSALALSQMPAKFAALVVGTELPGVAILVAVLVFYIVLGCFLDGISMVVLTMGVILPTIQKAGIDPLWFGIFIVLVVEMAQITPPVGFNLFVLQGMTKREIGWIAKVTLPFFFLMIAAVALIYFVPGIVTWLPAQMRG